MRHYDIWAVVKDPGGTNGILPVVDELKKDGLSVLVIANGAAVGLMAGKEGYETGVADSAEKALELFGPLPRALITSMCSDGGVGRDLVPLLRGKVPTIAFQDGYGVRLVDSWKESQYRPDHIVTNDVVGREIIKQKWEGFPADHVWTTGFPMLDSYSGIDAGALAAATREKLSLRADRPLVFFAGQGVATGQALGEVVKALLGRREFYLFPQAHPRTKQNFVDEMDPWQHALAEFNGTLVVDWFGRCTTPELVALAAEQGVTVSMYSTVLMEAAALRGQAISILYPDIGRPQMQKGLSVDIFPLGSLDCVAVAHNLETLQRHLSLALDYRLDQRAAQEQYIKVDGQNARRAADAIRALL